MIIMINGAFGSGKTTIAHSLCDSLPGTMLFDPEEVGYMLRNVIPEDIKRLEAPEGDFQDLDLWRELTVEVGGRLIERYQTDLIVPMTIRKQEYLTAIIEGFKQKGQDVMHFCLMASKETIHERLRGRGEEENNWCFMQTDACLLAYETGNFGTYLDTEGKTIEELTSAIVGTLQKQTSEG
ncbi:AAA family ATPase [Rossellomorea marisflavi]|uniref:AAA family ATPase n=1 Tax=Rossellomorea marisflavi TaxID=189381 RepID=UPI00064E224B|nr:AAA family ATPase [Rossellomorea marisflavi]KML06878.1 Tunicamycin resistance protein [Rossellomorea marisflavi]KML35337.1 Tunicamycin resistance protein [Rossellomorea marisflavi]